MFSSNTSQVVATATQAEAIDFDGTNDYLIRSTDLTGNTDGKTFTFSAWVWSDVSGLSYIYTTDNTSDSRVQTWISTTQVGLYMKNPSGVVVLNASATVPNNNPPKNTWIHVLWSIDLTSTSNRSCYINDVLQSTVSWDAYSNDLIDFTQTNHNIAGGPVLGGYTKARLSNVYLDKTYRDMSVTANRRLFVTADLKPAAGQAALNPILYLPMSDPTQPGLNQGTGGNFTLTGVVARSGRGPNQYNAPYSTFDGTADYVRRTTAPTGIADGKTFTLHCAVLPDVLSSPAHYLISFSSSSDTKFRFYLQSNGAAIINGYTSAGTNVLTIEFPSATFVAGRNYVIDVSVDLTDTAKRRVYVNGTSVSVTWSTYTNSDINFAITTTPRYNVGADSTNAASYNGKIGALWFNTSYIDLSVPANLAKFVTGTGIDAKPVDIGASGELPTGTSPLIYLPMYGNNAGKNYGTGGVFSAISGPYTGARGPNEFWGNKARGDNPDGSNNQGLIRTTQLAGIADSKTFSCSFWVQFNSSSGGLREDNIAGFWIANSNATWRIFRDTSDNLRIVAGSRLSATVSGAITTSPAFVQICVDLADTAKRFVYINGVAQTVTWSTYVNNLIDFTVATQTLMCRYTTGAAGGMDGSLGEFYFTTDYIDFSQEANRLKFRDAFGNPVDLSAQITAQAIPTPLIYMRMPPTSFGTNSGTGGDFALGGSPTDGGQF